MQAMDWSQLETLSLSGRDGDNHFFSRMNDLLPGLRHLSIDSPGGIPNFPEEGINFIHSIPPLETLNMMIRAPRESCKDSDGYRRRQFPLAAILKRHGQSLRHLTLHQRESATPGQNRPMLSIAEIDSIREACSQLTHLGLDLDRNETAGWPRATIEAILQLRR